MTEDTTYEGWKNYATWGVALVIDNDQGTHGHVRENAARLKAEAPNHPNVEGNIWTVEQAARFELAEFLKDFTEDLCGLEGWTVYSAEEMSIGGGTGTSVELSLMAQQVIQAGLAEVDWDEIATNILEER